MKASLRSLIPLAVMAVAAAAGLLLAKAGSTPVRDESLASLAGPRARTQIDVAADRFRGSDDAKVMMIEYSDFQCPFCIEFATTLLPELEREYVDTGLVRLAFRNFPLVSLHPRAMAAAELVECSRRQDRDAQVHDLLFAAGGKLSPEVLAGIRQRAGLDVRSTESCLTSEARTRVEEEVRRGLALGVDSTPTLLLGLIGDGDRLSVIYTLKGAKSKRTIRKALDDLVLEARSQAAK